MKRTLRSLIVATALCLGTVSLVPGCVMTVRTKPLFVVDEAPPEPRYEARPSQRRGYVWVSGHWERQGSRWRWVSGHWERERGGGMYWVEGRWERRGSRYHWIPGHWERGGGGSSFGGGGGGGGVIVRDHEPPRGPTGNDRDPPRGPDPSHPPHEHAHAHPHEIGDHHHHPHAEPHRAGANHHHPY